mgnify:CR=1 FL=1
MQAYTGFAAVYDTFMDNIPYEEWCEYLTGLLKEQGVTEGILLDLGCGTGSLTELLADAGYDMIGVDGSADMLSKAYERRVAENAPGVLFLCQDMRAFELYGTVGAVVSSLDCMNYLTGKGDLEKCFSLVHNYLDPGGVFLFDVNTPYKFRHIYGNEAYVLESEEGGRSAYCGWQNEYEEESRLCRFYLSVFTEEEDGRYSRTDEEQVERCYTKEELTAALTRAGFEEISFFGDLHFGAPEETTERWYVAAKCKK